MKRRTLILLLVLPLAVLAAVAGAALMIPTERVAALASAQAEAALGREVRIERVDLDLFPAPAVVLEGLAIAGAEPDAPALATVRRVALRPKLLPLLARRVVIDAITLERPRILVQFDENGASNLPEFGKAEEAVAEADAGAEEAAGGGSVAFLIDRFEIRDGRIGYSDDRTGTAIRLDGFDQRLRLAGELSGGELVRIRLEGEIDVDALGAILPEHLAVPIRDTRLRIEHQAMLDRNADSLALDHLAVQLQELALEGRGTVTGVTAEERNISLRLAAGPVDVGALVRSLPSALIESMAPEGTELPDVDGTASVRIMADGPLGSEQLPAVVGSLELDAFHLAYGGQGELIRDLTGRIDFTLDSLATEGLRGQLLGQPLDVAFAVRDLAAPVVDARLRAGIDLERASALGLVPDSLSARGTVGMDLVVHAPLLRLNTSTVDGTVDLAGVSAAPPTLKVPVEVRTGRVMFEGQRLESRELRLALGESDLSLELAADEWLPYAVGDTTRVPTVAVDARSSRMAIHEVLHEKEEEATYGELLFARLADRPINGRPAGEVAAEAGYRLPPLPPVALDGRYRAAVLTMDELEFQELDLTFGGTGERLELTDARFQLMGGGVQVDGRLGLSAGDAPDSGEGFGGYPAVLNYQLRDVGAAAFFDKLTPFRDHLAGSMLLAGTVQMLLDENLLPVRESVMAAGNIAISDGRFANWPALRALGEKLGLAAFDTLTLRDWAGEFQITGPRVTLGESVLEAEEMTVRTTGAFDFSGELDLTATMRLAPEIASRIRGDFASRLSAVAGDADGQIPIGLRITGPATGPDVQLDLSAAADNALSRAREEAESRARELVSDAVQDAASKLLPGDSAATPPDSARKQLESELKNRLRRLIPIKR